MAQQQQQQQQQGGIPITSLGLQDLANLKTQLEQEFEQFNQSLNSLRALEGRYIEAREALTGTLKPENKGRKILVPLTSSLYVPGEIETADTVLIDIGTGYFVEKKPKEAEEFMNRKLKLLEDQAEKVQSVLASRRKALEQVIGVMQQKIAQGGGPPAGMVQ